MRTIDTIEHLVYSEKSENAEIISKIRSLCADIEEHRVSGDDELRAKLEELKKRGIDSKKVIVVSDFRGRLIQKCPGTKEMICCNYMLINSGFNCIYDCVYCFLLSYLNSYGILLFSNYDEIMRQVDEFIASMDSNKIYRIGTGEFTDSLMLDEHTGLSERLIERFSHCKNVFLELKTKSSNTDHLASIREKGNSVIAFSLNTTRNIERFEKGTASLEERIVAAEKAVDAGYYVSFHFDPVILYQGWEDEYQKVLNLLFSRIDAEKNLWISVGGVRFTSEFKDIMRAAYPEEDLSLGEFVKCGDAKLRYFKPIRRKIYELFRNRTNSEKTPPFLYMCMESADMWELVFKKNYEKSEDLENDMADFLRKKTGCLRSL